jgi:hypothetical protein
MKIFAFLFFISYTSFSQNIDFIKSLDTVFIYLKEKDTILLNNMTCEFSKNNSGKQFILTNSSKKNILIFTPNDKNTNRKSNLLLVKRKKFMIENENKIINLNFIKEHGLKKVFIDVLEVNFNKKKIYIITDHDIKKRKMLIKKARINYSDFIDI